MKQIKKIASLVLALVMVLAMSVLVMAADNDPHTITVKQNADDTTEHQYAAYQIFAGDLATVDGKQVLSNIIWGSGVNDPEALLAELKADEDDVFSRAFADCKTAADVAKALSEFPNTDGGESGSLDYFARIVEKHLSSAYESKTGTGDVEIDVVGSGYYLVKDIKDSVEAGGAYTRALLEVVGDSDMVVKSEVPSGDKQVYVDDTNTADSNNATIGSHVSYKITSKVPNWAGYNYYYFIMNDTLSDGLTLDYDLANDIDSFSVTVGGTELTRGTDYYVYTGEDAAPKTFRLAFADITQFTVGADIVVNYSATVNDQAVIGTTGNPNTWTLQYSNNPDDTFDGERKDDENKPGLPADEANEPLGETPEEITLTYLTELDITKYANEVAEEHLLAGAEFTLTGISKQVVLKQVDYYRVAGENEVGTHYLLLDGTYTTEAPQGTTYVEIGVGTADTTTGYLKGEGENNYYVPKNKDEYIGETLYKLVRGTNEDYADVNTKYVKDKADIITYVDVPVSIEMTTDGEGKACFRGLGAGEYTLKETVTPEGFNTLEEIKIVISFRGPEVVNTGEEPGFWGMTWNGESVNGGDTGIFAQDVINQSGSLLPSTGGIGTTIFYVLGGILVVGACVLLVVRKRMSKAE